MHTRFHALSECIGFRMHLCFLALANAPYLKRVPLVQKPFLTVGACALIDVSTFSCMHVPSPWANLSQLKCWLSRTYAFPLRLARLDCRAGFLMHTRFLAFGKCALIDVLAFSCIHVSSPQAYAR